MDEPAMDEAGMQSDTGLDASGGPNTIGVLLHALGEARHHVPGETIRGGEGEGDDEEQDPGGAFNDTESG